MSAESEELLEASWTDFVIQEYKSTSWEQVAVVLDADDAFNLITLRRRQNASRLYRVLQRKTQLMEIRDGG